MENERILCLSNLDDIILAIEDIPGPVVLITGNMKKRQTIELAAAMCVAYSDAPGDRVSEVTVFMNNSVSHVSTYACPREKLKDLFI